MFLIVLQFQTVNQLVSLGTVGFPSSSHCHGVGGGDHCAAARQAAETAMAEAEQQRLPAAVCRQRRVEAYAEARTERSPGAGVG